MKIKLFFITALINIQYNIKSSKTFNKTKQDEETSINTCTQLRDIFDRYDLNHDKRLDDNELPALITDLGMTADVASSIVRDKNNDVTLRNLSNVLGMDCKTKSVKLGTCDEIDEFFRTMSETAEISKEMMRRHYFDYMVQNIFEFYDADSNEVLTKTEIANKTNLSCNFNTTDDNLHHVSSVYEGSTSELHQKIFGGESDRTDSQYSHTSATPLLSHNSTRRSRSGSKSSSSRHSAYLGDAQREQSYQTTSEKSSSSIRSGSSRTMSSRTELPTEPSDYSHNSLESMSPQPSDDGSGFGDTYEASNSSGHSQKNNSYPHASLNKVSTNHQGSQQDGSSHSTFEDALSPSDEEGYQDAFEPSHSGAGSHYAGRSLGSASVLEPSIKSHSSQSSNGYQTGLEPSGSSHSSHSSHRSNGYQTGFEHSGSSHSSHSSQSSNGYQTGFEPSGSSHSSHSSHRSNGYQTGFEHSGSSHSSHSSHRSNGYQTGFEPSGSSHSSHSSSNLSGASGIVHLKSFSDQHPKSHSFLKRKSLSQQQADFDAMSKTTTFSSAKGEGASFNGELSQNESSSNDPSQELFEQQSSFSSQQSKMDRGGEPWNPQSGSVNATLHSTSQSSSIPSISSPSHSNHSDSIYSLSSNRSSSHGSQSMPHPDIDHVNTLQGDLPYVSESSSSSSHNTDGYHNDTDTFDLSSSSHGSSSEANSNGKIYNQLNSSPGSSSTRSSSTSSQHNGYQELHDELSSDSSHSSSGSKLSSHTGDVEYYSKFPSESSHAHSSSKSNAYVEMPSDSMSSSSSKLSSFSNKEEMSQPLIPKSGTSGLSSNSEECMGIYNDYFVKFDKNGDGHLNRKEFIQSLKLMTENDHTIADSIDQIIEDTKTHFDSAGIDFKNFSATFGAECENM